VGWAAATMSTVGYGDRYPITTDGRVIGVGLMVAGIALLGVVTAALASWLIEQVRDVETEAQTATRSDIEQLRSEIARLTQALARGRADSGTPQA
jgi:voltage-gated potassium channel